MVRQIFLVCATALVICTVSVSTVHAQTTSVPKPTSLIFPTLTPTPTIPPSQLPLNLTLSPVTINLETKPGVSISTPIKIRNNGAEPESLTIRFGTFDADETGRSPELRDAKPEDAFMQWVSVDPPAVVIAPGEWETVQLTFSPPEDAALTYYYSVMFYRSVKSPEQGETAIQGVPAILALTTVDSPLAKKELQLKSFTAVAPFLEFLPQTFTVEVNNSGNVHVIPQGNIFIDGQGKKDLAVLSVNPGQNAVLPQSTREFEITWNDGFPSNDEDGNRIWDFNALNKIRFGKYTAHILLVYDNGERDVPIESFVSFWVIPWRFILIMILIPVTPALLVYLFMKWQFKRNRNNQVDV